ncbi:hypothetical protein GRO01_10740 [Gluconobacter roseus NBRC 3990]|uniref:Uncharacterized protein n=1 Tax=Gluconobacter roseus NBRC 3990 TaxID=1307950 RepID=A0A4Y3M7M0_9PROT|nr:hypothetical protein GRO01_10740 [Gluconobacter roseus NBRC 3990]GLP93953.1 hypothetical protein GCM10007871_19310 [Gluconobacter roseus NBRC 3990]
MRRISGTPHGFKPVVKKGNSGRLIGRTKGGMNTKLYVIIAISARAQDGLGHFWAAG